MPSTTNTLCELEKQRQFLLKTCEEEENGQTRFASNITYLQTTNHTIYRLTLLHHEMDAIKKVGRSTKLTDREHQGSSPEQK